MPGKSGVEGTLYTYPNNVRADLIKIAAEYGGSNVKVATNFEFGVTNTTEDFKSKFPFGQVPAFETSSGCLFDTMAIASYVGGEKLRGDSEFTRAQIAQYMNVAETQLFPSACQILYPCWGLMPNNKNVINKAQETLKTFMTNLNTLLEPRTYLVGESVTLADLTLALYMRDLYSLILDEGRRNSFENVTRWFNTIINQDEVVRVVGQTSLCVKPAQFDAKLFTANNPKQKKEPAPKKEAAPKKDAPKKEEKKEEQTAAPPKPAAKKPFADAPKPKLDIEAFKRLYWNEETDVIMKYFDENFVDGEWSVWTCEYKYNNELKQTFMTENLVQGMMQRLESMKKFAFGLVYVFGEENDSIIAGIWLGRGGGNFFLESDNWQTDIEHYNLQKLDMAKPEDKALWLKYISGGMDDYKGKKFLNDFIF